MWQDSFLCLSFLLALCSSLYLILHFLELLLFRSSSSFRTHPLTFHIFIVHFLSVLLSLILSSSLFLSLLIFFSSLSPFFFPYSFHFSFFFSPLYILLTYILFLLQFLLVSFFLFIPSSALSVFDLSPPPFLSLSLYSSFFFLLCLPHSIFLSLFSTVSHCFFMAASILTLCI